MGNKVQYDEKVKWEAIQLRAGGVSYEEIMELLNIQKKRHIRNWVECYKNGKTNFGRMKELKRERLLSEINEYLNKEMRNRNILYRDEVIEVVQTLREKYPLNLICQCLGITRSRYYYWLDRSKSD